MAIARSPSAGLPIASDLAIEFGRTGETRRSSQNADATGEQPSAWPPYRRGRRSSISPSRPNCSNPCQSLLNIAPEAIGATTAVGTSQPSCSTISNASVFEPSA